MQSSPIRSNNALSFVAKSSTMPGIPAALAEVLRTLTRCQTDERTHADERLLHDESVGMKLTNYHVDPISALHRPARVRECHPVRLAGLWTVDLS
jgi:hypothetical protein